MSLQHYGKSWLRDLLRSNFRSIVASILAIEITTAAIYEVLFEHTESGPIISWAGVVVGVYFGAHFVMAGSWNGQHKRD